MKTNTVSNTAFRGFGGPQGLIAAERIIEEIAYALGKDPLEVRSANFYGGDGPQRHALPPDGRRTTSSAAIVDELEAVIGLCRRAAQAVLAHNAKGGVIRKGIALTPVKFGISFTATWYNQAGALVHVYNDGSIHLNHGGTEMGQGLNTKVAQVVADGFQVDLDRVKITATTTAKVPNTSATAASSGSDLNGMAAQNAAEQIKDRLVDFAAEKYSVEPRAGGVRAELRADRQPAGRLRRLHQGGLHRPRPPVGRGLLQDAGDPLGPSGGQGAARSTTSPTAPRCREVSVDTLTGEYHVDRDRHPARRRPLAEPGDRQGPGRGRLRPGHGLADDRGAVVGRQGAAADARAVDLQDPAGIATGRAIFNVKLAEWSVNREPTIRRSKAVGEPPFMLGVSVLEALSMAVASVADYRICPRLDAPATPERVLMAIERLRGEAR